MKKAIDFLPHFSAVLNSNSTLLNAVASNAALSQLGWCGWLNCRVPLIAEDCRGFQSQLYIPHPAVPDKHKGYTQQTK
ncbi:MAG: hypothetical protein ABIN94_14450 [Ferruginibacter sp.]